MRKKSSKVRMKRNDIEVGCKEDIRKITEACCRRDVEQNREEKISIINFFLNRFRHLMTFSARTHSP